MIRKLKMLILKITFSPLWLLTLFLPIIYLAWYFFHKGRYLAFNMKFFDYDWKEDIKQMLRDIFSYWRL